jgi:dipeptide/tripeptide permease
VDASLTSGYRAAFVMAGCGLIIGALLATLLPRRVAPIVVEPAVAPAPAPGAEATRDELAPGLAVLDA